MLKLILKDFLIQKNFFIKYVLLFAIISIFATIDLEYKNAKLQFMIEDVVNYSDSTADTGEFDEFIASPQGERFFTNYHKLYDK